MVIDICKKKKKNNQLQSRLFLRENQLQSWLLSINKIYYFFFLLVTFRNNSYYIFKKNKKPV